MRSTAIPVKCNRAQLRKIVESKWKEIVKGKFFRIELFEANLGFLFDLHTKEKHKNKRQPKHAHSVTLSGSTNRTTYRADLVPSELILLPAALHAHRRSLSPAGQCWRCLLMCCVPTHCGARPAPGRAGNRAPGVLSLVNSTGDGGVQPPSHPWYTLGKVKYSAKNSQQIWLTSP